MTLQGQDARVARAASGLGADSARRVGANHACIALGKVSNDGGACAVAWARAV